MSRMSGVTRPVETWADMVDWLADSFANLDTGDVLDIGLASTTVYGDDQYVPSAQARSLGDGLVWLGLSESVQWAEPVFELDQEQSTVSNDIKSLAQNCVTWFRDNHKLHFRDLGCQLTPRSHLRLGRSGPA